MKDFDYSVIEGIVIKDFQPLPHHVMIRWLKKEETKGGIIIPQYRQRAHFMKGIVLALGPRCNVMLEVGQTVQFNGLSEKEFIGVQDPADRDTVFLFTDEQIFGIVSYDENQKPSIQSVGEWVLVKPDEAKENKIVMTDSVKATVRRNSFAWQGEVVSSGNMADSCVPGDRIAYTTSGATGVMIGDHNGIQCVVIHNEDVVGIMETV